MCMHLLLPFAWIADSAPPCAVLQATGRLRKNVAYFKVNYGIVGVGTTALVMVRGGIPQLHVASLQPFRALPPTWLLGPHLATHQPIHHSWPAPGPPCSL